MNYEEKLRTNPKETNNHDQSDNLAGKLADILARARDAGMDVDSERPALSPDDRRDMLRDRILSLRGELPSVVKLKRWHPPTLKLQPNKKMSDTPTLPNSPKKADCPSAPCSPLPPIRSVEEYRASFAEWEAAMMVSCATDDQEEMKRADAVCLREEKRWDECNHLFEFDEEGDIIGLANTKIADA